MVGQVEHKFMTVTTANDRMGPGRRAFADLLRFASSPGDTASPGQHRLDDGLLQTGMEPGRAVAL